MGDENKNGVVVETDEVEAVQVQEADDAEGYQFDLSRLTADEAAEFYKLNLRMKTVESTGISVKALLNPPQDMSDPAMVPYRITRAVNQAFIEKMRKFEGEPIDKVRFNVEDILSGEVQEWLIVCHVGNVAKQIELMLKYKKSAHKDYSDLGALDLETFLCVRAHFMDRLLDLTKN